MYLYRKDLTCDEINVFLHSTLCRRVHLPPPLSVSLFCTNNREMYSTLITVALFVSLAIQGTFAGFAINTPKLTEVLPSFFLHLWPRPHENY